MTASRKNSTGSYLQKREADFSRLAEESGGDLVTKDMQLSSVSCFSLTNVEHLKLGYSGLRVGTLGF